MSAAQIENKKKEKSVRKATEYPQRKTLAKQSTPEVLLKKYRPLLEDKNNIILNAQQGGEISLVEDLALISGKSQKVLAELIHTTAKTLQNYSSGSKRLPTLQSELLLKLLALYAKGTEVFESVESFNSWLQKPAFGLYNDVPNNLLSTSTGINIVMDELIRIEYGDLA